MNPEQLRDLVRYLLEQASETLAEAVLLRDAAACAAWRKLTPSGREYSWTKHNGTRTRVETVFFARCIAPYLTHARSDHDGQHGNVSDHEPLIVEMIAPFRRTTGCIGRLRSRQRVQFAQGAEAGSRAVNVP